MKIHCTESTKEDAEFRKEISQWNFVSPLRTLCPGF